MSVFLHLSQSHFEIIHVSLQGCYLFLQLTFLGCQLGVYFLLIFQAFLELLKFSLLSNFGLNQLVATVFCIFQVVLLLELNGKSTGFILGTAAVALHRSVKGFLAETGEAEALSDTNTSQHQHDLQLGAAEPGHSSPESKPPGDPLPPDA